MKILIITGLHPTVANPMSAIFITRRIKRLKEQGVDYDLYFLSEKVNRLARFMKWVLKRPSFKEKAELIVDGVQYNPLTVSLSVWDMLFYHRRIGKRLVRTIRETIDLRRYDLLHAHWVYPHGYLAALLKQETGLPCIVSAHGGDIHTNPMKHPRSKGAVLFALNYADKVIFNNLKLLETAKKLGYSGHNSVLIPNGVETGHFNLLDKEQARAASGLPLTGEKVVGYVGNLKPVKGADRLPEIFQSIAKRYSNVRFVIIGDGKLRGKIERRCGLLSLNVLFTGRIPEAAMPVWMNALDLLVLPSRNEGFPNVCLEAQACGCPVLGSDAGGIAEAIGDGGLVVRDSGTGFVEDYCDAAVSLLENPPQREQLHRRASCYNLDEITGKQIELYSQVLSGK